MVCYNLVNNDVKDEYDVWHKKLGHPNVTVMKMILDNENLMHLNHTTSYLCSQCQLGKNHKLPFSLSKTMYHNPLELVECDLWGPAPLSSDYGFKYYVAFVDAYTRYTWIYFLKQKSETVEAVKQFIIQVERQLDRKLKVFQTDGGSEFKPLKEFFNERGIIHRYTCPYTSQQNGMVERKHWHVVETGLTLLAQGSLPLKFWPEAFSTAVYLINYLPTKVLEDMNPHERLYGIKPDYSRRKVFGCLCFPLLRPYNAHKLDFRSSHCTFLGYGTKQKGYKCLTSEGKIIMSRHVTFNERGFPFADGEIKSTSKVTSPQKSMPPIPLYVSSEEQVSRSTTGIEGAQNTSQSHTDNMSIGESSNSTQSQN